MDLPGLEHARDVCQQVIDEEDTIEEVKEALTAARDSIDEAIGLEEDD